MAALPAEAGKQIGEILLVQDADRWVVHLAHHQAVVKFFGAAGVQEFLFQVFLGKVSEEEKNRLLMVGLGSARKAARP